MTTRRHTRILVGLVVGVCLVAGMIVGLVLLGGSNPDVIHSNALAQPPAQTTTPTTTGGHPVTPVVAAPGAGWNLIATTHGSITAYGSPGSAPVGTIAATWYESTAWVRRTAVTITATPFRIVVDLAAMHLELLRLGQVIMDAPAGVGTPQDPTPTGQFFVALFAPPPTPGYGPFVLVTSAHSNTITDWEESGDALIGIHGPLGDDSEIGTTGAAVSHGCVRLHETDLDQLRQVPAGTPVTIDAT
jgi:lipoprotein-anchoring transpeptidase ErfK/SrfK